MVNHGLTSSPWHVKEEPEERRITTARITGWQAARGTRKTRPRHKEERPSQPRAGKQPVARERQGHAIRKNGPLNHGLASSPWHVT